MKKFVGLLAGVALIGVSACEQERGGQELPTQQQPAPAQGAETTQQQPDGLMQQEGAGGAGDQGRLGDDTDLDTDEGIGGTGAAAGGGG